MRRTRQGRAVAPNLEAPKAAAFAAAHAQIGEPRALSALRRFHRPHITEADAERERNVYGGKGDGRVQAHLHIHRVIVSLEIRESVD